MEQKFNLNYSVSMGRDSSDPDHAYYAMNPNCILQPHSVRFVGFVFPTDILREIESLNPELIYSKYEDGALRCFTAAVKCGKHKAIITLSESYGDQGPFDNYSGPLPTRHAANGVEVLHAGQPEASALVASVSDIVRKCKYTKKTSNSISILCSNEHGLYTKTLEMTNDYSDIDLESHYGTGFREYHDALLAKMKSTSKGIVLLHGEPGTGKSYYIRHLISKMTEKLILYVPNAMIGQLASPGFNDFVLEWIDEQNDNMVVGEESKKKITSVLLVLEDAEKSLIRRDVNAYSDEVSTILNASDGIMNDFMSIQVLATFNVDISMIDPAVMRKRRALSVRSFGKLSHSDSVRLAEKIGVPTEKITGEMSIADIYQLSEPDADAVLFPELPSESKIRGFGR